jgi:hypothetical protein
MQLQLTAVHELDICFSTSFWQASQRAVSTLAGMLDLLVTLGSELGLYPTELVFRFLIFRARTPAVNHKRDKGWSDIPICKPLSCVSQCLEFIAASQGFVGGDCYS